MSSQRTPEDRERAVQARATRRAAGHRSGDRPRRSPSPRPGKRRTRRRRRLLTLAAVLAAAGISVATALSGSAGAGATALSGSAGAGAGLSHRPRTAAFHPGGPAPACQPSRLNTSDVLPGTALEVSPLPDSLDASPSTQISLLGAPARDISAVSVSGSQTGSHDGRLEAYSQGDGASFVPAQPFQQGETVTIRGAVSAGGGHATFAYRFTVAQQSPLPRLPAGPEPTGTAADVQHFRSRPDLQPPSITVTANHPGSAPGDVFAAPYSGPGEAGPMIFDGRGQLVWFKPMPPNIKATMLQTQTYDGRPVLSWWQGYIPPQGFGEGVEEIDDTRYDTVRVVRAGNGLTVDLHDFRLLGNEQALFTVFNPIRCNLAAVGGRPNAAVTDGIFQLVDLKTGLVMREWHALDHVRLSNSVASPKSSSSAWPFDYFHINSLALATDGSMIVSSRNTSAYYILDPATLAVRAEVGGRDTTVRGQPGTTTSYQHDVEMRPDGTITLLDNGGVPQTEPQTRAIVEKLDLATGTVSELAQYTHASKPLLAGSQANFQTLANGDAFVGWGAQPYVTEFSSSGATLFDAQFPPATESYRAYRFVWSAQPAGPPAIAVAHAAPGALTVSASWNGATSVSAWRVLAGPQAGRLTPVTTRPRSGFETTIPVPASGPYVAVQALGPTGSVLATSPPAKA